MKGMTMDIFTRIVLPYEDVLGQSVREIITTLRDRGIDPGQMFYAEIAGRGIVLEQNRDAKPIPGECQFR